MTKPAVLAIAAHPDDIELMMAGTLLRLGEAGYSLHMLNIANGCCGSMTMDARTTAETRWQEAQAAAAALGAAMHPPLCNDIEIVYEAGLLRKVAAIVRAVSPSIVLAQSPVDYMEDHTNACRLAVTAAFVRGMPNYETDPPLAPVPGEVTLYHALPWGLRGPLGERITATHFVDIAPAMKQKREALAAHASQKEWLDETQGLDSYLVTMEDMAGRVGEMSGIFQHAEGWRKHLHLGFCGENDDPLRAVLGDAVRVRQDCP